MATTQLIAVCYNDMITAVAEYLHAVDLDIEKHCGKDDKVHVNAITAEYVADRITSENGALSAIARSVKTRLQAYRDEQNKGRMYQIKINEEQRKLLLSFMIDIPDNASGHPASRLKFDLETLPDDNDGLFVTDLTLDE